MKIIRYLFYMILILSNIEVLRGDYSIDSFLDYLQEKGYYNLIQAIKNAYGDDIAIKVCKELLQSNDCEIVVRVYMTGGSGVHPAPPYINIELLTKIIQYFEQKYKLTENVIKLIELIVKFYPTSINKETIEEIINFIEKILFIMRIRLIAADEIMPEFIHK